MLTPSATATPPDTRCYYFRHAPDAIRDFQRCYFGIDCRFAAISMPIRFHEAFSLSFSATLSSLVYATISPPPDTGHFRAASSIIFFIFSRLAID
jgi:hypothetical protein